MAAADSKGNSETVDIEFGKTNANDEAIHVKIPAAMWKDAIVSRRRWIIGGLVGVAVLVVIAVCAILFVPQQTESIDAASSASAAGVGTGGTAYEHPDFELLRSGFLDDYNSTANIYRHRKTGLEVLSVLSNDANKMMGVTVRTLPDDNTGKAHVLEHMVLSGSESFPVRDVFLNLVDRSLFTYLNAITRRDSTLYPVSSANLADFYNLVKVYLAGVFHPLGIHEQNIFKTEAWRYELDNATEPEGLSVNGIVLNEIRGAYSGPGFWWNDFVASSVFPDTSYAYSHGGFPTATPDLTYEELQQFYYDYYHPGNARVFFWGDDPEAERLNMVSASLEGFEADPQARERSQIAVQELPGAPQSISGTYGADDGAPSIAGVVWALTEGAEGLPQKDVYPWSVLSLLLGGTEQAPLLRSVQGSGLGTPYNFGLDAGRFMQPIFEVSVLMAPNATAVREVVFASLDEILKTGFPAEDVQAAIGQIEIGVPRLLATNERVGVSLFTEAVNTAFTYDRDVFQAFLNRSLLEELKSRVDSDEDVFGDLIRRYLLENPNRFDLVLVPSGTSIGESEAAALAATVSSLTPESALALAEETAAFREWQGIPDSPEALATVPALELSAIEDVLDIPTEVSAVDGGVLLEHPQPAGGLVFAQLDLRLNNVSDDQVALLPLLGVVLRNTGSGNLTAAALEQRINSRMAVIEVPEGKVLSQLPSGEPVLSLRFKGSATSDMAGDLMALMNDMLLRPGISRDDEEVEALVRVTLQNRARSTEIELSQYEARTSAATRAEAMLVPRAWLTEQLKGLSHLQELRRWEAALESPGGWVKLRDALQALLSQVLDSVSTGSSATLSLTGDEESLAATHDDAVQALRDLSAAPTRSETVQPRAWNTTLQRRNEAVVIGGQANYVTSAVHLLGKATGYEFTGAIYAGVELVRSYLTNELRVNAGAYGGVASFDDRFAPLVLESERDPQLAATLEVYRSVSSFLREFAADMDSAKSARLEGAVLSSYRKLHPFQPPAELGEVALDRYLSNTTLEDLREELAQLVAVDAGDLLDMANAIDAAAWTSVAFTAEDPSALIGDDDGQPLFQEVLPL